ncbi:MAG: glutamate racemase [Ruminococcus callidus]
MSSRDDTMKNDAIGVFDSGMGGLTAVKELNAILPHENIIYFGDTARIPYGSRSPETVLRYAKEDVAFLRRYAVKMIIAACGTVSSIVGDQPFVTDMPFTGVVLPAARTACEVTRNGRIGIIGTPATIRSGSYEKAIQKLHPEMTAFGQACPLFVHLSGKRLYRFSQSGDTAGGRGVSGTGAESRRGYPDLGLHPLSGDP